MPNLINIAASGLNSYKVALETVGNNIANVNTEGYSKQTVSFTTQTETQYGNGYLGNGVTVQQITRQTNDLMTRLMHQNNSDLYQYRAFSERSSIIDNLFSQEGTDVTKNLGALFQSLAQANSSPDSLPTRTAFMAQASFIADQLNTTQNILNETKSNLSQQFSDVAAQITSLSKSIAAINNKITSTRVPSPRLLDERDKLVLDLSKYMNVSTIVQSDGSMNVTIGKGETLVVGNLSAIVTAGLDPSDGSTTLYMALGGDNTHEITKNVAGGLVEGMVDYDNNVLRDASRQLGLITMAFAEKFNEQNKLGVDFDGQIGRNIFTDFNSANLQAQRSYAKTTNADPTIQLNVRISDYQKIQNSDYQLHMTGATTGILTRESDGTVYTLGFSSSTTPIITSVNGVAATDVDGFELNFASAPSVGDYYSISPTDGMAGYMRVLQKDPNALALASPVRVYADLGNASSGTIALQSVTATDATNAPDLSDNFEIRILNVDSGGKDFSYEIYNATNASLAAGPLTANYGDEITVPNAGYTVSLDGPVKVGDKYLSRFNDNSIGDNTNGLLLANIQNEALLNNGTETLSDRYSHLVGNIGIQTYQAGIRKDAADVLFKQSESLKLADVGVSLDEEAANLVSLQQAYQANAKVMQAVTSIWDMLIQAM